jgi:hypothetical protein
MTVVPTFTESVLECVERSPVVEWVAAVLLRILWVSASNLGPEAYRDMIFMVLRSTCRQIPGIEPAINHDQRSLYLFFYSYTDLLLL